jgi:hypothetical protein
MKDSSKIFWMLYRKNKQIYFGIYLMDRFEEINRLLSDREVEGSWVEQHRCEKLFGLLQRGDVIEFCGMFSTIIYVDRRYVFSLDEQNGRWKDTDLGTEEPLISKVKFVDMEKVIGHKAYVKDLLKAIARKI